MRSTFDTILIDASKVSYCGGVVGCTSRIYNITRDSINNNHVFVNKSNNTRSKNITPVGLYTREGSKSQVESENHANIDNNTRRMGSLTRTFMELKHDYGCLQETASAGLNRTFMELKLFRHRNLAHSCSVLIEPLWN